ncbi:hypothetical protein C6P96_05020 [Burkholderia multivorans]|nr:hypothetical protein C6P95_25335 [Burkholderia multivorans]PRF16590.1 hypothetical protein C6P96_05020 [Burkholderia multivorans]
MQPKIAAQRARSRRRALATALLPRISSSSSSFSARSSSSSSRSSPSSDSARRPFLPLPLSSRSSRSS